MKLFFHNMHVSKYSNILQVKVTASRTLRTGKFRLSNFYLNVDMCDYKYVMTTISSHFRWAFAIIVGCILCNYENLDVEYVCRLSFS